MKEQGIVTKFISSKLVEVGIQKSEACDKCRGCHAVGEGMMAIEAVNEVGARREDEVLIEIPSGEIVKGSILVFLLPVLFLITGYLIGSFLMRLFGFLSWEEGVGVVFGILFLLASFIAVRWYDKNVGQKEASRARILKIVKPR